MFQKLHIIYYLILFKFKRIQNREVLSRLRQNKLESLEKFLISNSTYYAKTIHRNGGLLQIPIISKAAYFENFDDINTVNIKYKEAMEVAIKAETSRDFSSSIGDIAVGLSSGTTGNRGIFITSSKERNHWVAAMIHKVIGFKFRKRKIAFFLRSNNQLYENSNSSFIQFNYFDLNISFSELLHRLNVLQPDILIAQPTVLRAIAESHLSESIRINPEMIISVAEVLEENDKYFIGNTFNQIVHQIYQCTEGFLAYTCIHGKLHMNEDVVFFQERWLDEKKTRFHPIITDMYRRSQPMVRYELNDILSYNDEKCKCGSPFRVLKSIEGRHDDILIFKKMDSIKFKFIFGDPIRKIFLLADRENIIVNYQIHQESLTIIIISLQVQDTASLVKLKISILHEFELWTKQNDLQIPTLDFLDTVIFDPMKKFRRISRAHFIYPANTTYL